MKPDIDNQTFLDHDPPQYFVPKGKFRFQNRFPTFFRIPHLPYFVHIWNKFIGLSYNVVKVLLHIILEEIPTTPSLIFLDSSSTMEFHFEKIIFKDHSINVLTISKFVYSFQLLSSFKIKYIIIGAHEEMKK